MIDWRIDKDPHNIKVMATTKAKKMNDEAEQYQP